ncbi:hypothetical protein Tco_0914047 [Tanacetum coccineum]
MSFSKCPGTDAACYSKPLDSLKNWNDHFFWVDTFTCPASFSWNTSKSVSNDLFPKSSEFNAEHYATLVAYPALFHKYLEPFLCLIGISRNYSLDEDTYPQFLREDGQDIVLLDTTVGRVVPLLLVAPACGESELEDSMDRLFDEGCSGDQAGQGDSASGNQGAGIQYVSEATEPSHPAKKLRDDHGTPGGPTVGSKSWSAVQCLLAGAVLNAKVRGEVIPTLPFVTSSVSATPEREDGDHTESFARTNLRTIGAPQRTFILLMTMTTIVTSTVEPTTTVKEKLVESSVFGGGSSSGADHTVGGFSGLTGSNFIVGDDGRTCREMVDEFAPSKFFASIRGMEHDQLFTKFNVGVARQMSLSAKVRMRVEFNIREKRRLSVVVEEKNSLLKARDEEFASLKAQLLVKEAEAAEAIHLRAEVSWFENFVDQLEKFQDEKMKEVNEKFDKLSADFVEMALHLEEIFYPYLLTTIFGRQWLLTNGMELAIAKCLNSTEYLSVLGTAIGKAIEKGMQEGLFAGITHGAEGRKLADVAAYNPSAEDDYLSALQRLQSVNFSLIAELRANKDASVDTIMNLLRLEDTLTERLGLTESQPHVSQLMVLIHHSLDQRVIGASALSLSLDVSSSRVQKIKENIARHVSALRGVFVPLAEPLSVMALEGTEVVHADGQESIGADGQTIVGADVNPFPNIDDAELNVPEGLPPLLMLLC